MSLENNLHKRRVTKLSALVRSTESPPYTTAATSNRFVMNTREIGNDSVDHAGREYGTELTDEERFQLLEYLKTQ